MCAAFYRESYAVYINLYIIIIILNSKGDMYVPYCEQVYYACKHKPDFLTPDHMYNYVHRYID